MKKSNVLIISACLIAILLIVIIEFLGAASINNYLKGKDPYYARTYKQWAESHKKIFPRPSKELIISGEITTNIIIIPGQELAFLSNPKFWDCRYTDLKNGKSVIRIKKLLDANEPITITLPDVSFLTLDDFSGVTVKNLNQKEIHFNCTRVHSFNTINCTFGTLGLNFPSNKDQQYISIEKTNHVDNLTVIIKGSGNFFLAAAGKTQNLLSLSDSVQIVSNYNLLKKL
jgi:hypothetical protein